MSYSAGVVTSNGEIKGKAFNSKLEAEEWILSLMEQTELKSARIRNLTTGAEEKII